MKKIITIVLGLCFVTTCIAETPRNANDVDESEKKAMIRKRVLEKTGGIIEKQGDGVVRVINSQRKISTEVISDRINRLNEVLRIRIDVQEGEWSLSRKNTPACNAIIYVVDDSSLPMSLIAPESQWGLLNVSEIDAGPRFNKALVRVMIGTLGAGVSQFKGSPMQTVQGPQDLDKLHSDGIPFDAMQAIMRNLQNIGVTQSRKTTYRKACEEGWAAAPTNKYQKAIWDEVHSIPQQPMKIEFDPKKGR